ncbi:MULTISPECIES: LysR family transcriptional regulator [Curtobacterium]|uniref:LysR family transcriptional regulator n=1 Tax=Curtobacterium TaxID=2034 RepID=UPI000F971282|nr:MULTISPECIES: LysR family transcriptional regulator [Curtobacterium]MCX2844193.1 LysR family transcriptional regulator [Curtobacterium flaccumfaciens pv. oortii]ROS33545.1 DNA-binding transcriptional LysR family regulator [Curtobacterium sp. PhB131]
MAQSWFVKRRVTDRKLDLDTLDVLQRVSESGSLSMAASQLGITQQAVSARIAAAERMVGVQLVVRSSSGSWLTDAGATVMELAAPVLDAAARLEAGVHALRLPSGTITVAASQTIAELMLPEWLLRSRRAAPEISVRMLAGNSTDVIGYVRTGAADIGFVEGPHTPVDLHAMPVADDELTVVVAAEHPWASAASVTAADVAATPLLVREQGSGTRAVVEGWLRDQGLTMVEPAAQLDTTAVIRANVRSGVAPAVMSVRSVRADVDAGVLVRVPVDGPSPLRRFTAIWSTPPSAATAAFLHTATHPV